MSVEPYYTADRVTLYQGDGLAVLRELPEGSVQCCVTSPPCCTGLEEFVHDAGGGSC